MHSLRKASLLIVTILTLTGTMAPVAAPQTEAQAKAVRVYIAPYQGKKFHYHKNCRGLRHARSLKKVSIKWAKQHGYKQCKINNDTPY